MKKIIVVLSVLVVVLIGIMFWQQTKVRVLGDLNSQASMSAGTSTTSFNFAKPSSAADSSDLSADWSTYTDQRYGFEFKIPPGWTIYVARADTLKNAYGQYANFAIWPPSSPAYAFTDGQLDQSAWSLMIVDDDYYAKYVQRMGNLLSTNQYRQLNIGKGNYYYLLNSSGREPKLFEKFVASFRFWRAAK